ncbi:MAG: hypothetical protein HY320_04715, partial [Armatimonadetes bacterium]|nr:hypothetical protein [Armatimonadota bacterium]
GRPEREQDAQTYVAAFIFDALGQRIALQDAHTRRWTSVYEVRGGELATQDPLRAGIIF